MGLLLSPLSALPTLGAPSSPPAASADTSGASTPGSVASARRPPSEAWPASLALLAHPSPTLAEMGSSIQPIARSTRGRPLACAREERVRCFELDRETQGLLGGHELGTRGHAAVRA